MRPTDMMNKQRNKRYADTKRRAQVLEVEPGDQVLLKNTRNFPN